LDKILGHKETIYAVNWEAPRSVASQVEEKINNLKTLLRSEDLSARIAMEELPPGDQKLASAVNDLVSHLTAHSLDARQRATEQTQRLAAELVDARAAAGAIAAITKANTEEEAIAQALEAVRSVLGWAYASYWVVDKGDQSLHFAAESGSASDELRRASQSATFKEEVGLCGRAWARRDVVFVSDLSELKDCVRASAAQGAGLRSAVCLPIEIDGHLVATMDFFTKEVLSPSTERLDSFRNIARSISAGMARLREVQREKNTVQDSEAVRKVMEAVSSVTTEQDAIRVALDTVRATFGWAYASFWALDRSENALKFSLESGTVSDEFHRVTKITRFSEGVGLSGRTWRNRDLFFVRDLGQMVDCPRRESAMRVGVKSGICFPIMRKGEVVGTMDFFMLETIDPSPERLDSLRKVGQYVSAAFERIADAENQQQDSAAVSKVIEAVGAATNEAEAIRIALDTVRATFGWAYGSYWALDRTENALKFSLESGTVSEEFHRVTKTTRFSEGVGLSGRTWRNRDLFFVRDLGQMVDCPRRESAQRVGVKSGVCFPIMKGSEVIGTMDFFMLETIDPSPERLESLRKVGQLVSGIRDVFVFVDEGDSLTITVQPPAGTAVPASAVASRNAAPRTTTSSLRVSAAKLDELINIVGELVTMQARLSRFAVESGEIEISYIAEETERLTNMLRDNTMSIRMLPIEATFARYRRLVRDLAGELGKEIELVTEGGDTELDKSVIDQIADPLVHIIRNSVDHGIESPAERRQAGKAPGGRLVLSAAHSGSHVLIRVADDGRGIDPARVRAKAIEKGLIDPHAELSEAEVFALIFRTGFSTAASVSAVSGRGVGMDVVKRNVEALRGAIDLTSTPGRGATITLKLPLTLAIIDGLLVRVSTQHFVFPVAQVLECLEIDLAEFAARRHEYIEVRGKLVPLIFLQRFFSLSNENLRRRQILIAQTAIGHCGFVVDEVIGDHKTVIKQLGPLYRQVEGVAGATILGDGGIALILDADKLAQSATQEAVRTAA